MITLVSYPRSGNTFLRNVLYDVYGIESKTFHFEAHGADQDWENSMVVKTHQRPHELPSALLERPIVYLIRDGRDAIVSMAHHRKDIFDTNSKLDQNIIEAIDADEGSYFGGWSIHVLEWLQRASVVIYFEDLISDPAGTCEKLRAVMDLPAQRGKAPTFTDLKNGQPEYGSGKHLNVQNLSNRWFRSGKVNGWKKELSEKMQTRFWHIHGEAMEHVGYSMDGGERMHLDHSTFKTGTTTKVLIEASKLADVHTDGIKRFVSELLRAALLYAHSEIDIHILVNGKIERLESMRQLGGVIHSAPSRTLDLAKGILKSTLPRSTFNAIARSSSVRSLRSYPRRRSETRQSAEKYDVIVLTLPQHFEQIRHLQTKRLVGVIHDLTHELYPEFHQENNVRLAETGMNYLRRMNADLIAVSRVTRIDLGKRGLSSTLIYEGVNRAMFKPINSQHWQKLIHERYNLPTKPFFLSVSTLEPRKNIKRLIEAYSNLSPEDRDSYPLVLAGRKGWNWDEKIIPKACRGNIYFTGYIDERHLPALYSRAHAFCYLSIYEGFGLPVLEAMACGCPVMVASGTSTTEITNGIGVEVNPLEVESISVGLMKYLDKEFRSNQVQQSINGSWRFSWRNCWIAFDQFVRVEESASK